MSIIICCNQSLFQSIKFPTQTIINVLFPELLQMLKPKTLTMAYKQNIKALKLRAILPKFTICNCRHFPFFFKLFELRKGMSCRHREFVHEATIDLLTQLVHGLECKYHLMSMADGQFATNSSEKVSECQFIETLYEGCVILPENLCIVLPTC